MIKILSGISEAFETTKPPPPLITSPTPAYPINIEGGMRISGTCDPGIGTEITITHDGGSESLRGNKGRWSSTLGFSKPQTFSFSVTQTVNGVMSDPSPECKVNVIKAVNAPTISYPQPDTAHPPGPMSIRGTHSITAETVLLLAADDSILETIAVGATSTEWYGTHTFDVSIYHTLKAVQIFRSGKHSDPSPQLGFIVWEKPVNI